MHTTLLPRGCTWYNGSVMCCRISFVVGNLTANIQARSLTWDNGMALTMRNSRIAPRGDAMPTVSIGTIGTIPTPFASGWQCACGTAFLAALILAAGCSRDPPNIIWPAAPWGKAVAIKSVEYYEKKLLDRTYRWDGPCPPTYQIPSLHAARALAYIGDPAVPALFRAVRNPAVDIYSVVIALDEIGLPVDSYQDDLDRRDPSSLERWWHDNREKTVRTRSEFRVDLGLPPIESGKEPLQ